MITVILAVIDGIYSIDLSWHVYILPVFMDLAILDKIGEEK